MPEGKGRLPHRPTKDAQDGAGIIHTGSNLIYLI